ncbi:MAG TPA: hypothetical protein VGH81_06730 [Rudaea sp.]|jgi:hypothetical protein
MRSAAASVVLIPSSRFERFPHVPRPTDSTRDSGTRGIVPLGPTPEKGISIDRISALVVRNDGTIVIGDRTVGTGDLPAIGRLDANGNWDQGFADNGFFVLLYGATSASMEVR